MPGDFPHTLVSVRDGCRYTDDFIQACKNLPFVSRVDVASNDEFVELCNRELELNESNLATTVDISKDIQLCCMRDYVHYINDLVKEKGEEFLPKGVVHNYFATLVNLHNENVCGNVVVFKTEGKKLVDLEAGELFPFLANFYYVKTYQVRNGELVEMTFPNNEPVIRDLMKDKKKHVVDLWEFYISKDVDMGDLGFKKVDMKDFEGLIVLKRKENMSVVWKALEDVKVTQKPEDLRGLYEDLDGEYVREFFS